MAEPPTYDQLNAFGKCIVDKKLANSPKQIQQMPGIRELTASLIDHSLIPEGQGSKKEWSVVLSKDGKVVAQTGDKQEQYPYSEEVNGCIGQFKPDLPLTPESVRQMPAREK